MLDYRKRRPNVIDLDGSIVQVEDVQIQINCSDIQLSSMTASIVFLLALESIK